MKRLSKSCWMILPAISLAAPALATGGWATQQVELQQGWNMIWIEIDPVPDDPATVLQGIDYESIGSFEPGRSVDQLGTWVSFHRDHPAYLNTLTSIQGKRGYLIKAHEAGTLDITGRPVNRAHRFSGQASNLFGVSFDPGHSATFDDYFAQPNDAGKLTSVYKLQAGTYVPVSSSSTVEERLSYWINVLQDLPSWGPLKVDAPLHGYQFGIDGYTHTISIEVPASESPQTLTARALPSAPPPFGEPTDASEGDASWLQYHDSDDEDNPWKSLADGVSLIVPANEVKTELQIRCVRAGRTPATIADTNSLYQGLIEITDGHGQQVIFGAGMEIKPVYGLWVGQARLTQVSTLDGALADAQPLNVSLILVIPEPGEGDPQLLDKAYIEVDRDGRTLKYRYNAIMFHEPVTLLDSCGDCSPIGGNGTTGKVQGTINMSADHALNPYRHRYNPEHQVGYDIVRVITMQFMATDPDPISQALGLDQSMGDNELAGWYEEVIHGVSLNDITVSGPFKLHRLGDTSELQPQP